MSNLTGILTYVGRMSILGSTRVATMFTAMPPTVFIPICMKKDFTFFQKALRKCSGTSSGLAKRSCGKFSGVIWARPSIIPGLTSKAFGTLLFASFYLLSLLLDMLVDINYNLGKNYTIRLLLTCEPSNKKRSIVVRYIYFFHQGGISNYRFTFLF